MPQMTRDKAKELVTKALRQVADFDSDIESFNFDKWHDFHKSVFLSAVSMEVSRYGHRLTLNAGSIGQGSTLTSFIDHVFDSATYLDEPREKLNETDGDLQ